MLDLFPEEVQDDCDCVMEGPYDGLPGEAWVVRGERGPVVQVQPSWRQWVPMGPAAVTETELILAVLTGEAFLSRTTVPTWEPGAWTELSQVEVPGLRGRWRVARQGLRRIRNRSYHGYFVMLGGWRPV